MARRLVPEVALAERDRTGLDAALIKQHAMLEGAVDVERDRRAGEEIYLGAEQWREGVHR